MVAEPSPARRPGRRWDVQTPALGAIAVIGVLVAWEASARFGVFSPLLLPAPETVASAFRELIMDGTLQTYIAVSLGRVLEGFVIAVLIAVPLGAAMAFSRIVEGLADPLIELARPVPPIAVIPLAILWFGIGEASKLFIIVYGAFFPLIVNVLAGFRTVDPQLVRAAQALGASRYAVFWHVTLRSAFQHLVVGMRLGMAMAFLVLVGAELIAASSGLGFLIQDARNRFRTDEMTAGIITIGVLGFLLNRSLLELERRLVPWRQRDGK